MVRVYIYLYRMFGKAFNMDRFHQDIEKQTCWCRTHFADGWCMKYVRFCNVRIQSMSCWFGEYSINIRHIPNKSYRIYLFKGSTEYERATERAFVIAMEGV